MSWTVLYECRSFIMDFKAGFFLAVGAKTQGEKTQNSSNFFEKLKHIFQKTQEIGNFPKR